MNEQPYHKYVFDFKERKVLGNYESMYQAESTEGFDSWFQDDSRSLELWIGLLLMQQYNFSRIVDVGCGKGAFTHLLKKKNNHVLGIDVSETAVAMAKVRFPDIDFLAADVSDVHRFERIYRDFALAAGGPADLTICANVFSLIKNWPELVHTIARHTRHLLVSLFIPEDSLAYVKTPDELAAIVSQSFDLIEVVELKTSRRIIVFGSTKSRAV